MTGLIRVPPIIQMFRINLHIVLKLLSYFVLHSFQEPNVCHWYWLAFLSNLTVADDRGKLEKRKKDNPLSLSSFLSFPPCLCHPSFCFGWCLSQWLHFFNGSSTLSTALLHGPYNKAKLLGSITLLSLNLRMLNSLTGCLTIHNLAFHFFYHF